MPSVTPPLQHCLDPVKPAITCAPSKLFGVPQGNNGRNGQVVRGIVIHCLDQTEMEACGQAVKLSRLRGNKNSLHYGILLSGGVQQYVDDGDIAYGLDFTVPLGGTNPVYICPNNPCQPDACDPNPPLINPYIPLWGLSNEPIVAGVPFDYYLLHIGIEAPARKVQPFKAKTSAEGCIQPTEDCAPCDGNDIFDQFAPAQLRALTQLVAALAFQHNVPLDDDHVNFFHNIDPCERDECGCAPCISQFICHVSGYCQAPRVGADATYVNDDELAFVYGETKENQKTAQPVGAFLAQNLRFNSATSRVEFFDLATGTWSQLPVV